MAHLCNRRRRVLHNDRSLVGRHETGLRSESTYLEGKTMKSILHIFTATVCTLGLGFASADDGLVLEGDANVNAVTVSVPATANRGDVINMSVSYNPVPRTDVTCWLVLPTNDPSTYLAEWKIYIRRAAIASSGVSCPFQIPGFIQIEGFAIAFASVVGEGSGFAVMEILP